MKKLLTLIACGAAAWGGVWLSGIILDESDTPDPQANVARKPEQGRLVVERSRCLVCHDLDGVTDLLPVVRTPAADPSPFATLANDVKCLSCHTLDGRGGNSAKPTMAETNTPIMASRISASNTCGVF